MLKCTVRLMFTFVFMISFLLFLCVVVVVLFKLHGEAEDKCLLCGR